MYIYTYLYSLENSSLAPSLSLVMFNLVSPQLPGPSQFMFCPQIYRTWIPSAYPLVKIWTYIEFNSNHKEYFKRDRIETSLSTQLPCWVVLSLQFEQSPGQACVRKSQQIHSSIMNIWMHTPMQRHSSSLSIWFPPSFMVRSNWCSSTYMYSI